MDIVLPVAFSQIWWIVISLLNCKLEKFSRTDHIDSNQTIISFITQMILKTICWVELTVYSRTRDLALGPTLSSTLTIGNWIVRESWVWDCKRSIMFFLLLNNENHDKLLEKISIPIVVPNPMFKSSHGLTTVAYLRFCCPKYIFFMLFPRPFLCSIL